MALSHSGSWRGVLAESEEQAYLVACLHGACERRRADPPVADRPDEHGVRSGDRGAAGVVRRVREVLRGRGRCVPVAARLAQGRDGEGQPQRGAAVVATLPDGCSPARAQDRLDGFCVRNDQQRTRVREGRKVSVAELAAAEPLRPLPARLFPAVMEDDRVVTAQALVHWHGNQTRCRPGTPGSTSPSGTSSAR